jgi:hypothetical protein
MNKINTLLKLKKKMKPMILVKFRDIDPDEGTISQDGTVATCEDEQLAKWVKSALERDNADLGSPNREFYLEDQANREATYEERVAWFVANYYKTGMEYESMLESMKEVNLDSFEWYDETVSIPTHFKNYSLN